MDGAGGVSPTGGGSGFIQFIKNFFNRFSPPKDLRVQSQNNTTFESIEGVDPGKFVEMRRRSDFPQEAKVSFMSKLFSSFSSENRQYKSFEKSVNNLCKEEATESIAQKKAKLNNRMLEIKNDLPEGSELRDKYEDLLTRNTV